MLLWAPLWILWGSPDGPLFAGRYLSIKRRHWESPGGPVVKTWFFHCHGWSLVLGLGTEILQAMWGKKRKKDALLTPQFLPVHPSVSTMSPLLASVYDQFSDKPGSAFLSWVHLNLQASPSSTCSLICTHFPGAVRLGFPDKPRLCPHQQGMRGKACQMLG